MTDTPSRSSRYERWSEEDATAFERARDLLNAVIAAYSARIGTTDHEGAARLRDDRRLHLAERDSLTVWDRERVAQINTEYPQLLSRVRAGEL
ncbi:hypothetical protein [Streptomyces kronopolitis]